MTGVQLHLGDCLEFVKTLEPGSVDAVVMDGPYGVKYTHREGGGPVKGSWGFTRNDNKPIAGDDGPFDPTPWLGGPCLMWGANHFARRLPEGGSWCVWDKAEGVGPADSFVDAEFAWCSVAGIKRNIFRYLWKGVLHKKPDSKNNHRFHPTQKPVALMAWCIQLMGLRPGATILDPYMGSGTTGVAAVRLGFNFIGCEVDEGYFAIAKKRIQAEQDRHPLFERLERVEQVEMFS